MKPLQTLQKLMASKLLSESVKKAVRVRLEMILTEELRQLEWWENTVREKLNHTRQKQIEARFNKDIQALKIVIHKLTPFFERTTDIPSIIVKKPKKF